jgi:hypothetical protein
MDTVLPHFWLPIMEYSSQDGFSLMAMTFGTDVLMRHSYTAVALYRGQVNKAGGYLNISNSLCSHQSIVGAASIIKNLPSNQKEESESFRIFES